MHMSENESYGRCGLNWFGQETAPGMENREKSRNYGPFAGQSRFNNGLCLQDAALVGGARPPA